MAELEAEHDVQTTYLLMTESVFYNLASSEGAEAIARLRELGHARRPPRRVPERRRSTTASTPSSPGTTRSAEYMSRRSRARSTSTRSRYFAPPTYRSDSNQHWRSGCPHEELRGGGFPWLQILVHPEIWVYQGATMGLTMRAMLNTEKTRRLEQLAADGIDLG